MSRVSSRLIAWAVIAATASGAHARDIGTPSSVPPLWKADRGYSIQLDNDYFAGAHVDQDYSWGAAVTLATQRPRFPLRPLHVARASLDSLVPGGPAARAWTQEHRATQFGILAMTPGTLRSAAPLLGDRPYASLLFFSGSQLRVPEGENRVLFSSFTFGMLGLHAAETIHRSVHRMIGNELPLGWNHQISAGGEPTARYVAARQWLLDGSGADRAGSPELKLTVAGSAGFITEGSVALAARWGRTQSPWWSFAPELADYTSAPLAPVVRFSSHNPAEKFFFAGVRLKARAYNALLQGQFRHSDVRVQGDDLAHTQAEAWLGLASTWEEYRITYTIRYASAEMLTEPGRRKPIWAGITFEKML